MHWPSYNLRDRIIKYNLASSAQLQQSEIFISVLCGPCCPLSKIFPSRPGLGPPPCHPCIDVTRPWQPLLFCSRTSAISYSSRPAICSAFPLAYTDAGILSNICKFYCWGLLIIKPSLAVCEGWGATLSSPAGNQSHQPASSPEDHSGLVNDLELLH